MYSRVADLRIQVVKDSEDKFIRGASNALLTRCGVLKDNLKNEYRRYSFLELAELALMHRAIVPTRTPSGQQDVNDLLSKALSTEAFIELWNTTASTIMMKGFNGYKSTYQPWTKELTVNNFNPNTLYSLDAFTSLQKTPELGEIEQSNIRSNGEMFHLDTFGKIFNIPRVDLINADFDIFTETALNIGEAAHRTLEELVYNYLYENPVLADGIQLFHSSHNNDGSGALSVKNIDLGRLAMAQQRNKDGQQLNAVPDVLLAPFTLAGTAKALVASEKDYDFQDPTPNKIYDSLSVISSPVLDTFSTEEWYLVNTARPPITILKLREHETPQTKSRANWETLGIEIRCVWDIGVFCSDFRRVWRSSGV